MHVLTARAPLILSSYRYVRAPKPPLLTSFRTPLSARLTLPPQRRLPGAHPAQVQALSARPVQAGGHCAPGARRGGHGEGGARAGAGSAGAAGSGAAGGGTAGCGQSAGGGGRAALAAGGGRAGGGRVRVARGPWGRPQSDHRAGCPGVCTHFRDALVLVCTPAMGMGPESA